mgnify:CR=1 FL=1
MKIMLFVMHKPYFHLRYHDRRENQNSVIVTSVCFRCSVAFENVACVDFVCHIVQGRVIPVGDDGIR